MFSVSERVRKCREKKAAENPTFKQHESQRTNKLQKDARAVISTEKLEEKLMKHRVHEGEAGEKEI